MVSPGEGYRLLAAGEVIREGDEVRPAHASLWTRQGAKHYFVIDKITAGDSCLRVVRRPVRMQSQWRRYLDEGETIREGDEYSNDNGESWILDTTSAGEPMLPHCTYRRPWPETSVVPQQVPTESNEPEPAAESAPHEDPLIQHTLKLFSDGCFVPPPPLVMCGCKRHFIQPGEDPYAAHRTWLEFKHEYGHVNDRASASVMWRVQGVGVSAPKIAVGFQLQGEAAEDI